MSWATVSSVWSWEWSALWEELVVEDTGVTIVDGVGRYAEVGGTTVEAITITFMVALTLVPLDQSPTRTARSHRSTGRYLTLIPHLFLL